MRSARLPGDIRFELRFGRGVPEPAQGLDVRHAAAQFDAREGGLADSRSFGYFLLGEVPTPADGPELVAQPQIAGGLSASSGLLERCVFCVVGVVPAG